MSLLALALTLLFGGVVGIVAGLLGVGGGIIMIPLLYLLFAHPGWSGINFPADHHAVVAHATSLFVIVPTAVAALIPYQRSRLVEWRAALPMAALAVLGAVGGVHLAVRIPAEVLKAGFGLFLVISALNVLNASRRNGREEKAPGNGRSVAILGGLVVGLVTALLGVGGGIVAIPVLIHLVRLDMKRVAATSLGVVVFSALAAALTYAFAGLGRPGLPPPSVGYIYLPAGLALLPGALLTARLGVRLNQKLNPRALKVLFGLTFLLIGLRLFIGNLAAL